MSNYERLSFAHGLTCGIAIGLLLTLIAVLVWMGVSDLAGMFEEFGSTSILPLVTRLVIHPTWIAVAPAIATMLVFVSFRAGSNRRRVVIAAIGAAVAAALIALTLFGAYAPIFELAPVR